MPRACSVCQHADRIAIDRALVEGVSYRDIARQFGGSVSKDGLSRHKAAHLSAALVRVVARREERAAEHGPTSALERLEDLYARACRVLGQAEGSGQTAQQLGAIREARGLVEVIAKITGELREAPTTSINVLQNVDLARYTRALMGALQPYVEARIAAAAALKAIDVEVPE